MQLVFLVAAAAALAAGAALRGPLDGIRSERGLVSLMRRERIAEDPDLALLQLAPGGLRVIAVNYLWIRSQELKQDGRLYDARQLREAICRLMPYHSGAWSFLAWDMSWNISVATHTAAERWMWVYAGIELLRDKGLAASPRDLVLYRQIAWTFFSKMGGYTDEMHQVYKQRWAEQMDRLLGGPPLTGSTADAVEAFRPVAEAPASPAALRADPAAAGFLDRLDALGVGPDLGFIKYYNRYSDDPLRGRLLPLAREEAPEGPRRETVTRIASLMSDDDLEAPRAAVVAFVRRKLLREQYRMDPEWMLKLMERYGPLDWRSVHPHAIYWATMGLYRSLGLELEDIHAGAAAAKAEAYLKDPKVRQMRMGEFNRINTERTVLGALKSLTRVGRVTYSYGRTLNPARPARPVGVSFGPDWRFIKPAHDEYVFGGAALVGAKGRLDAETNVLRDGHVVFLSDAVVQLYIGGREADARDYYETMIELLKPKGEEYDLPLRDFVFRRVFREGPGPTFDLARAAWTSAMVRMYRALARGDMDEYGASRRFALGVYRRFREEIGKAPRFQAALDPFPVVERTFLTGLLLRPLAFGLRLPLLSKSVIYNAVGPSLQAAVYPDIAPALQRECLEEGLDFEKAFPPPARALPAGP